jgi:hypothetical protein
MTTKHGGVPGKKVSVSEGGDDYVLSELKRLIAGESERLEWVDEIVKLRAELEGVRKEVRMLARKSWQHRFSGSG